MAFHIVLVEPEIPQNTGNIVRTCAATGAKLHLVKPLGFSLADRYLKRAGLDYWDKAEVQVYDSLAEVPLDPRRTYYITTKGEQHYTEFAIEEGSFFVFGKETAGLPRELLAQHSEQCMRIPMRPALRSLNLANSVAIVLYEALRQTGFAGLV